jgi:nitric oxide reductase large subunit
MYVWIGVAVLVLVVLGAVGYGVFGAFARLGREVAAFDAEVRPVLEQVQATQAAAQQRGSQDSPA